MIIRTLKARSALIEEWMWHIVNIECDNHDDDWVGQVIFRALKKKPNVRYINCGKQGYLKRECRQGIPRNIVSSNTNRMLLPPGVCRRYGKGWHWTNECRLTRYRQGKLCHWEISWGTSCCPPCQVWLSHSLLPWGKLLSSTIKNLMHIFKNHTTLDDRTTLKEKTNFQEKPENIIKIRFQHERPFN